MSLIKDSSINAIGSSASLLLGVLVTPFFIHYVGTERYGLLILILAIIGYFTFLDLGISRAITQRLSALSGGSLVEKSDAIWTAVSFSLIIGILGSIIVWFSSRYYITYILNKNTFIEEPFSSYGYWLMLMFPTILLTSVLQGVLQSQLKFKALNSMQFVSNSLSQLLPLAAAASGYVEMKTLLPLLVIPRIVILFVMFIYIRKDGLLCGIPRIDRNEFGKLINYGGWTSTIAVISSFILLIDRLLIGSLGGAQYVFYYGVSFDLVMKLLVLPMSISNAIFPRFASATTPQRSVLVSDCFMIVSLVMTPVIVIAILLINPAMHLWLGKQLNPISISIAEILLLGVWIISIVTPNYTYLMATKPKTIVQSYLIEIPIYILMLYVGMRQWGIIGVAVAWCLRALLDLSLVLYYSKEVRIASLEYVLPLTHILMAVAIVLMIDANSPLRWCLGIMLVGSSLINSKLKYKNIKNKKHTNISLA